MTITTHAAVGAVIGRFIPNPIIAFALGFVSHFLLDIIPHGDCKLSDNFRFHKKHQKKAVAYAFADGILALFFVLYLANTRDIRSVPGFTWGIIGSVLPDLIVGFYEITKPRALKWFYDFHFWVHHLIAKRTGDVPLYVSLIVQCICVIALTPLI